jgi:hypothetical protein
MWGWLIRIATWLAFSPEVRQVVRTLGDVMNVLPDGFVGRAFSLVRENVTDSGKTNAEKFAAVYYTLEKEYPDVKANTSRVVIESAVAAVKKGLPG